MFVYLLCLSLSLSIYISFSLSLSIYIYIERERDIDRSRRFPGMLPSALVKSKSATLRSEVPEPQKHECPLEVQGSQGLGDGFQIVVSKTYRISPWFLTC